MLGKNSAENAGGMKKICTHKCQHYAYLMNRVFGSFNTLFKQIKMSMNYLVKQSIVSLKIATFIQQKNEWAKNKRVACSREKKWYEWKKLLQEPRETLLRLNTDTKLSLLSTNSLS